MYLGIEWAKFYLFCYLFGVLIIFFIIEIDLTIYLFGNNSRYKEHFRKERKREHLYILNSIRD